MSNKKIMAIVAYSLPGRVIGRGNTIPWRLSADMRHFKELTRGHIVIMGRKTFESFDEKYRPLPDRTNVVVTKNEKFCPHPTNKQTFTINSIFDAMDWSLSQNEKIFIIGGGEIYAQAISELHAVHEVIATEVDAPDIVGDTHFTPVLDAKYWDRKELQRIEKDEKNSHSFTIVQYTKK